MAPAGDRRDRVAVHYDELSPHYAEIWGEHIHHGYYRRGDEDREEATRALVERLIADMELPRGSTVLDVGCGIGGTSRLLCRDQGCRVTGVTLSLVQARMARDHEDGAARPRFVVGDAAALPFARTFDALLAVEVLSHVEDRGAFFSEAARLLGPGGRIGVAAWLKASGLSAAQEERFVRPIEDGMLVTLPTREEYEDRLDAAGLTLVRYRDISAEVARTWDLCIDLVAKPAVWSLAVQKGSETLAFVKSFRAMRSGFANDMFRYALIAATKR